MEAQEIAIRLGVAVLFGSLIGFERQWLQRMAGLRTNSLVAVGAAGFVVFSAMVGTFAGAGELAASGIAAGFVVLTNLFLRPLVRLINRQPHGAAEIETHYSVELRCQGDQEAHIRALLLQAASAAGLGLRRLTSENLEDSPQVTVSALLVSANRNDAALEQIIGRISLEPFVTAVHWQAARAAAES